MTESLFQVADVKAALWLLLGGGLDEEGKEAWLSWRLAAGRTAEEVFSDALALVNGQVAT